MIEKIKYNLLFRFFKNKKKLLWTLTNNLLSSAISTPSISVLKLSTDTTIGNKNEKIYVTNDSYQSWYIINNKNFHKEFVDKIEELSEKNVKYNFSAFFFLPKGCLILISPIESKKPPKGKTDEFILFGEFSTAFQEDSEILSNDFSFTYS